MEANFANIRRAFIDMKASGWDVAKPLRWGHFFVCPTLAPLWGLVQLMLADGYQFESLHRTDDGSFVLQVSIACVRSAAELHRQNKALNQIVEELEVGLYDGWDAGPVQ